MADQTDSLFNGLSKRDERVLRLVVREETTAVITETIGERLATIEQTLYDHDGDDKLGLVARVRRIESSMSNIGWAVRIAIGAAIIGLVTAALGALGR